jgi:hypothetical protein
VEDGIVHRHNELARRLTILLKEYEEGLLPPTIQKWRGVSGREPHMLWPQIQAIIEEMEMIALHFYGADVGQTVRLIGTRYNGALVEIENVEIPITERRRFTPLGEKPRIRVISPKGRHTVMISGHLWELLGNHA